jgi:hypothetical protein
VDVVQTIYTHYTVLGAGDASGTVTFVTAPPSTQKVVIYNDPPLTQLVDYIAGGSFPAETHEEALDRLTIQQKRTREITTRAILLPDADTDGSGAYDAKSNRIKSLGAPTATTDATSKTYVDALVNNTALGPAPTGLIATGSVTSRLLADRWGEIKNVKDFGAVGDGVADDTVAIQAAVDSAIAAGGGTVFFPGGTYSILSVDIRHGLTLVGDGAAVITRPNNAGGSLAAGKWIRSFTTQNDKWNNAEDSPPLVIQNLIFDGNMENQFGWHSAPNSDLEQAAMIFLTANTASAGRLRVVVDSCTFLSGSADAIHTYQNVDLTSSNCWANDVWRGGLTITGGYTKIRATNWRCSGNTFTTGIDVEVNAGSSGYGGSLAVDIEMSNFDISGDWDASIGAGSTAVFDNINVTGPRFHMAGGGECLVSNSRFHVGESNGGINRIVSPGGLKFVNCQFIATEETDASGDQTIAAVHIFWSGGSFSNSQRVEFLGCEFDADASVESSDTVYGINCEADDTADTATYTDAQRNILAITGCTFGPNLDTGIQVYGGTQQILTPRFLCPIAIRTFQTAARPVNIWVDSPYYSGATTVAHNLVTGTSAGVIRYTNTLIDEAMNLLATDHSPYALNSFPGSRTVISANTPAAATNTGGLLGDVWQLNTPVAGQTWQWVCTVTHITAATWVPLSDLGGGITVLANDATPTVSGGSTFTTGGTTTVTDFDDGTVGQTITVLSEHAITITDGTHIILHGSANFVMASSDSLTLVLKADNKWYETARMVN